MNGDGRLRTVLARMRRAGATIVELDQTAGEWASYTEAERNALAGVETRQWSAHLAAARLAEATEAQGSDESAPLAASQTSEAVQEAANALTGAQAVATGDGTTDRPGEIVGGFLPAEPGDVDLPAPEPSDDLGEIRSGQFVETDGQTVFIPDDYPDTVPEIVAWVDENPSRAAAAWERERSVRVRPRVTLARALEAIAPGVTDAG